MALKGRHAAGFKDKPRATFINSISRTVSHDRVRSVIEIRVANPLAFTVTGEGDDEEGSR